MRQVEQDQLQQLITWKANTQFFVEKVAPWMRSNIHRVNFDVCNTGCGTYACAAGWYSIMRHNMRWVDYDTKIQLKLHGISTVSYEFGPDRPNVFGFAEDPSAVDDLDNRAQKMASYAEKLQTKIDALQVGEIVA